MPDGDLQRLGVLVTRPAHQAEGLCRQIEQAGGVAIGLPLIEIAGPEDEPAARASLAGLAGFDIVIFISANAVHRCYLYIGKELPAGPAIACIGLATARQLAADFGRRADLVPDTGYNSEALLAMPELRQLSGKRILIIKGEGGRNLLADSLADRGGEVGYANLYRRRLPAGAAEQLTAIRQNRRVDVIVLTSGEGIDNLLSLADEATRQWLAEVNWLVIHPRLAEIASQRGYGQRLIISDGPGDEQILHCLHNWVMQKNKT